MTEYDFRKIFEAEWRRIDKEAEASKESHRAVRELERLYRSLPSQSRFVADQLLTEWALSDDEKKRFDALWLIDEFLIVSAIPTLKRLAERFGRESGPSAPYSLAHVDRILGHLEAAQMQGE